MPIEKRDVMFKTGETFAAAWLFLPKTAAPGARAPAVAMAHGLGAVKEMYLEPPTVQERNRDATEGGKKYIPSPGRPGIQSGGASQAPAKNRRRPLRSLQRQRRQEGGTGRDRVVHGAPLARRAGRTAPARSW